MASHTLRYESPERLIIPVGDVVPHAERVGGYLVTEHFKPNVHPDIGAGSYRIVIEADVSSENDLLRLVREADELARQFDIGWCYLFDKPLKAVEKELHLMYGPDDWTGNYHEVEDALWRAKWNSAAGKVTIHARRWLSSPFLPLKRLLSIRTAFLAAPAMLRELIELHVSAHKARLGGLFMFAKALEVVGKHYGVSRKDRNSGLQKAMTQMGVTQYLNRSVPWLFDVANERFEIRHAVDNKATSVAFHPRLTLEERSDFEADANLILRAFIADRLGVDILVKKKK